MWGVNLLLIVLLPAWAGASAPLAAPGPGDLPKWLGQLAADDPAVRDAAQRNLIDLGPAARPALLDLMRHGQWPEQRSRAAAAVICIPSIAPGATQAVRQLLGDYYAADTMQRYRVVAKLAALKNDDTALATLLRLLPDEPSNDVAWGITRSIIQQSPRYTDELSLGRLRAMERAQTAPALVLAGWAWTGLDADRSNQLLARALQLEGQNPSGQAQLDWVYARCFENALLRQAYDEAADVLRHAIWHADANVPIIDQEEQAGQPDEINDPAQELEEPATSLAPRAVLELFALHAQIGPLRGFAGDLQTYRCFLSQPEMIYTLGRMYQRSGQAFLAGACDRAALAAGGPEGLTHIRVADFLSNHGWREQGRSEYLAALASPDSVELTHAAAYDGLAEEAGIAGDDATAARYLQKTIDSLRRVGIPSDRRPLSPILAESDWRQLRAACSAHDQAAINQEISRLSNPVDVSNPDIVIDLVLTLRQAHRDTEAAKIFAAAYEALRPRPDQYPPDATDLNSFAWLCARCDEHLDEALAAATAAIHLSTGRGAMLDTAAEANFRVGNKAEAIRLETQALLFKPGDLFMMAQLKRFSEP